MRGARRKQTWTSLLAFATVSVALGQAPQVVPDAPKVALGGTPTVDYVSVQASTPGCPLRYGNIIAGSERIDLNGRNLKASEDYAIDYESGVIYLKVAAKAGSVLTVAYRYNEKADPNAPKAVKGLAGFKFDLVPGGLSFMTGLGVAERAGDGSVLMGNTFGLNNAFKLNGGGKLSGVFMMGERSQSGNRAGMNMRGDTGGNSLTDTGKSQLILQNLSTKALGGDVSLDYQDVSKNFTSFSALGDSGLDDAAINRLRSERGLTRMGFNANGLKMGSASVSSSFRKVSDEAGTIDWRSYGVAQGGFKANFSSQYVESGFARFKDIAEQDREQLMRERGIRRENWASEFASKTNKISYVSSRIEDVGQSKAIDRSELSLSSALGKLSFGSQNVSSAFGRMDSLLGQEKATYGLEAGLSRQWTSLNTSLFGKATEFSFDSRSLSSNAGAFNSKNIALKAKTWSIESVGRSADKGFAGFHGMNDAEKDQNIVQIARMYGPGSAPRPEDRHYFGQSAGVDRNFTSLAAQPFKGWNLNFSELKLTGQTDGGSVQSMSINRDKFEATYRRQQLGDRFSELNSLMSFEKMKLGNVAGLDRSDFGLKMSLGGHKNFAFSRTTAGVAQNGFDRTSGEFKDKKIEVKFNSREVDSNLQSFNGLVDSEKDLLMSLQGYRQRDASLKWQIMPNFNIEAFGYDAASEALNVDERIRTYNLAWSPLSKTQVNYTRNERSRGTSASTLFAEVVERISLSRDFGKLGQIAFLDEKIDFDGSETKALDSRKQYIAWQTKLNQKTDLRTAQTNTDFQDGTSEKVSENTVSTSVSKTLSLSVTDVNVDREGDERDERRRNYGFWWDLGKGLRISYGYARQLVGENVGQLSSTVAIGNTNGNMNPDQIGQVQGSELQGVRVGGGYGVNQWDQNARTQAFSNFSLATAKPVRMGMFKEVSFRFGMDQASDYSTFLRENRLFSLDGKLGSNKLGYQYVSQMHTSGTRGIDRIFRLDSDMSDKRMLTASVFYKVRTLPWNDQIMVRNFNFAVRPAKALELVHRIETNPEIARADVFLGSLPQASRSNKWELNWKRSTAMTVGANWQELVNDQNGATARTAGVSLALFENSGSPLRLFYGLEQADGNVLRSTKNRYSVQFDQRAGPNQSLSFFLGNLSYQHRIDNGFDRNNWSMRMNYQLRF